MIGATKGNPQPARTGNTNTKPVETPAPTSGNGRHPDTTTEVITSSDPAEKQDVNQNHDDYLNEIPKGRLDDKINHAYFDRIKDGMSHSDLVKIFEDKGMLIGIMTVNGRHTLAYMWATANMKKRIRVTFEKDKVVEKQKEGF